MKFPYFDISKFRNFNHLWNIEINLVIALLTCLTKKPLKTFKDVNYKLYLLQKEHLTHFTVFYSHNWIRGFHTHTKKTSKSQNTENLYFIDNDKSYFNISEISFRNFEISINSEIFQKISCLCMWYDGIDSKMNACDCCNWWNI